MTGYCQQGWSPEAKTKQHFVLIGHTSKGENHKAWNKKLCSSAIKMSNQRGLRPMPPSELPLSTCMQARVQNYSPT